MDDPLDELLAEMLQRIAANAEANLRTSVLLESAIARIGRLEKRFGETRTARPRRP